MGHMTPSKCNSLVKKKKKKKAGRLGKCRDHFKFWPGLLWTTLPFAWNNLKQPRQTQQTGGPLHTAQNTMFNVSCMSIRSNIYKRKRTCDIQALLLSFKMLISSHTEPYDDSWPKTQFQDSPPSSPPITNLSSAGRPTVPAPVSYFQKVTVCPPGAFEWVSLQTL